MRILVLGASGGVGHWFTRLAVQRGHQVTALVRDGARFDAPPGVHVRRSDVLAPETLDAVMAGQDAVVSCLGLRRAGRNPWAPLLSPPDLTTRVAALLVPAMRKHRVSRLMAVSAGGVAESFEQLSWAAKQMVSAGNVGVAYQDLAEMERVLATSGLDWMAVRPVTLTDGAPRGRGRIVGTFRLTSTVRRSDVAQWMLDALEKPSPFPDRFVMLGG